MAASCVADYPQLLKALATDQKIVYLCGAGVSMSLGCHRLSWSNWILAGKDYLLPSEQIELEERIGSWTTDELIDAATFLLEKLKTAGSYESFMTSTVGSLHPRNNAFKDSLRKIWRAGDIIATTNYDLTIEESIDASSVSYSAPAEILSVIRGGENKVIHLHGMYDRINHVDDIIADDPQYKGILANAGAQFIQNLISTHPIIIVGCGGTVEDPNLSGFMSFVVDKLGSKAFSYFYLMKSGDAVPVLPANAIPVFYGDDYEDLPIFLADLAMRRLRRRVGLRTLVSVNPYQDHSFATTAFGRIHFSNGFSEFTGREEEFRRLDAFLESNERFSWWLITGEGGMGKSRLVFEWLRSMPTNWFGFFTYNKPQDARAFDPFTDTVVVFDYVLGREQGCSETIQAYLDAFDVSPYKLRILLIERNPEDCLENVSRALESKYRIEFEAGAYGKPLAVNELSVDDEIVYTEKYLQKYLPLLPASDFVEECKRHINETGRQIEEAFRKSVDFSCYRPLFLSIFTEVWIGKEGRLSLNSIEDLLSEYLDKEVNRWKQILGNEDLAYSYLRLLAMACAIGRFNISDVYGNNYLEEDEKNLTAFFDRKSSKPGAENVFDDLFVHMAELAEDNGEDPLAEAFLHPKSALGRLDDEYVELFQEMDDDDRFAYFTPYIKLHSDPREVYLRMLADGGTAGEDDLEELEKLRAERIERVEALPNHAWIIEPVFPGIIKEFVVSYVVNERDIARFTKLARSNSVFGISDFINRSLEDWKENALFQRMAITPPDEVLNYFEYYVSLLISIRNVDNIKAVEQALIESAPCFLKHEMELWRRISVVLTERKDIDRLYDSGCRFIEYLKSLNGLIRVRDEAADVFDGYCVGLHNSGEIAKYSAFLRLMHEFAKTISNNMRIGLILCENYGLLCKIKLYKNTNASVEPEWNRTVDLLKQYGYSAEMCKMAMSTANAYILTLVKKRNLDGLNKLEKQIEKIYRACHVVEVAEIAALCSSNIFSITHENSNKLLTEEYDKIKKHLVDFPTSMYIIAAYLTANKIAYMHTAMCRKVPEELIEKAKKWAEQHPEEIEIPEGYFGLLYARLVYEQVNGQRNEQRRIFNEMKAVAERADYSKYSEGNEMLEAVKRLRQLYGY